MNHQTPRRSVRERQCGSCRKHRKSYRSARARARGRGSSSKTVMTMDRDKEREVELESLMFANCLMLGLDPFVIGAGGSSGTPRTGLFRHSNPKVGEQLLYFILSCLRGPSQSAKDFDKVWPIFDSSQSRDFRKVVQNIISELESQGALPRCNSRVSSLATCCGPRFVELLWQLSLHALREVHKRTYPDDVASNPLPASLTDVAFSHASALLPVTKARIALERRKFLKNAEDALQQQSDWSNLAHELTAQYRSLRADEAFLKQELERMQEYSGSTQDDDEEDHFSRSSIASKATSTWDSILSQKSKHEVLASGPIEDLIAHREHRYRISGSSLVTAMDRSNESLDEVPMKSSNGVGALEVLQSDEGEGSNHHSVDVAEVFRRWTHALQQVHKQSLQLAKTNGGDGPELLMQRSCSGSRRSSNGHCEALGTVLAEQQQHHANIKGLINQVKEVYSTLHKSIGDLEEEVDRVSTFPSPTALKHKPIDDGDYSAAAAAEVEATGEQTSVDDLLFPEFCSAEEDCSITNLPEYDIKDLKRSVRAEAASSLPASVVEEMTAPEERSFVPRRGSRWEVEEEGGMYEKDPVHSPPLLLLESCFSFTADEDLLAPLSELEAAMMER